MIGGRLCFAGSMRVRDARDAFFRATGMDARGYTAPDFHVRVGPITLRFPNPGLLPLHDLHHVVTGYDGDLVGEAEISAFELRGGGATPLIRLLSIGALGIALIIAPVRVLRAWRRARGVRSLYALRYPYERLLDMRVSDLRALCGVPADGLAFAADASPRDCCIPRTRQGQLVWTR